MLLYIWNVRLIIVLHNKEWTSFHIYKSNVTHFHKKFIEILYCLRKTILIILFSLHQRHIALLVSMCKNILSTFDIHSPSTPTHFAPTRPDYPSHTYITRVCYMLLMDIPVIFLHMYFVLSISFNTRLPQPFIHCQYYII